MPVAQPSAMLTYDNPIVPVKGQSTTVPPPTAADLAADRVPAPGTAPMISAGAADAAIPATNGTANKHPHHIWLVTGPAGVGKSSVAEFLSKQLNVPYIEGDEFHPPANIEKMSNGIPLTDADRWDWLTALREESLRKLGEKEGTIGVVLTCSALKKKYRDVIRVANYFDSSLLIHFIFLSAPPSLLLERVAQRTNHYMGPGMVQSQFAILEAPQPGETDIISIDVSGTLDEVKHAALQRVVEIMSAEARNGGSN